MLFQSNVEIIPFKDFFREKETVNMFFQPKMEVISFKDFLAKKETVKARTVLLTTATAMYALSSQVAQATGI